MPAPYPSALEPSSTFPVANALIRCTVPGRCALSAPRHQLQVKLPRGPSDDAAFVLTNGSGTFSSEALLSTPLSCSWYGEHNRVASPMEQIAARPCFCAVVLTARAALE